MAYKVFTNGSTLQASEVNDNLMKQAVATFSNAAARTAAITAPVEGQMTYLEDVDRYESYNGTSWGASFGLSHVATQNFSAVASVSFNNVFTSAYENYLIKFYLTTPNDLLGLRFRAGGTDNTAANYKYNNDEVGTSSTILNSSSNTFYRLGFASSTDRASGEITVFSPQVARRTSTISKHVRDVNSGGVVSEFGSGFLTVTTAYDGFTFLAAGNITGTIRVYGLKD